MNPQGALIFIIDTLFSLYILIVMTHFILQTVRADFYNPISQFIVNVSSPLLTPIRQVIPKTAGLDIAALVLIYGLTMLKFTLLFLVSEHALPTLNTLWLVSLLDCIKMVLQFYWFAILIVVIMSWIPNSGNTPIGYLLYQITEPLLARVRRAVAPIGGIDLSPLIVLFALSIVQILFRF